MKCTFSQWASLSKHITVKIKPQSNLNLYGRKKKMNVSVNKISNFVMTLALTNIVGGGVTLLIQSIGIAFTEKC